uniref:4.1m domain-containing protein n=1 Tax=Mesocestoides corti TaxID=53468 RepID=A0A5K3FG61_MESCO
MTTWWLRSLNHGRYLILILYPSAPVVSFTVLKIQLVVYQNEPISYDTQSYTKTHKWADTPTSSYWEPRIVQVLQELCHASTGYQRVAAIRRLSFNEAHNRPQVGDPGRMIAFEVLLFSTGHGQSLADLEELIKHRLDEAYLAGVGPLEPNASYIQLIAERMEDPQPALQVNQNAELIHKEESEVQEGGISVSQADSTHQLDPPQQDYPGSNSKRPISVRQTAHDLAVQNSWRHREVLNQPGVIAGIVGSTVAALLLLILLILFCIYRLRKKDEGSYSLEEPKKSPAASNSYMHAPCREFYA